MSRRNAISDDDGRKDAARLLLNQPLVRASTDPEAHRLIRRHKDALAQSFRNHLGYRLVVEPHFTELVERYDPPHGRAAMTGMSGGARMSCRFAAANSHMVSMVGAVGGVRAPAEHPARPVPVLAFHGSADRINPYGGSGTGRWVESVADAVRAWGTANGNPGPPSVVEVSPTLTRTTFGEPGCPGEVTLWSSKGAGHTWPGSRMNLLMRFFLGRISNEINASREIWSFERAHTTEV